MSINHDDKLGPKSTHARLRDEKTTGRGDLEGSFSEHEKPIQEPAPVHQHDGAADMEASPQRSQADTPAAEYSPPEGTR